MGRIREIAILGAGNGGVTAAADLTSKGFNVRLFDFVEFTNNLKNIKERGGILFKKQNIESFIKPSVVTNDIKEAVKGAEIIMLTVPSFAIEKIAKDVSAFLEDNQIIFINGAAALGSLRFRKVISSLGVKKKIKVGETSSLTYATRVLQGAEVNCLLEVKNLLFATYPKKDLEDVINICKQLYESLIPAKNIWETALNNGNPETHTGPSLLNAGRIEYSNGEFYLYREGITPNVSKIIKAVSEERKELCKAMHLKYISTEERLVRLGYSNPQKELHSYYNNSAVFTPIKGPNNLKSRYFFEDISMGLVLWSSLGKKLNIDTPVIDSIIKLGGVITGTDFWSEGLTLDKLELNDISVRELQELF